MQVDVLLTKIKLDVVFSNLYSIFTFNKYCIPYKSYYLFKRQ